MKLFFPYTNPIAFEKEVGDYQPYMDAYKFEGDKCWAMPMMVNDLLTFQFSWKEIIYQFRFVVFIDTIDENGVISSFMRHDITPTAVFHVGDLYDYTWGVHQIQSQSGTYNGVFFLNERIGLLLFNNSKNFR